MRARTTLLATGVVAVVLVVAVAGLALAVQQTLTTRLRQQAQDQVDLVAERLLAGLPPAQALQASRGAQPDTGIVPPQVEVLDREGHPVVGPGFFTIPGVAEEGVSTTGLPWAPTVRVGRTNLAIAQRRVEVDGELLLVVAASPLAEVVHSVDAIIRAAQLGIPLLVVLVGLVTWAATGRALRPIERIRSDVEGYSATTLDRRVPVPHSDDEVARLAVTMNGMLDRLETAATRQREFVADAAHELRSPLATIRTELEVMLAHPSSGDWPEVARGALADADRLERLVDDLLRLARLDAQALPSDSSAVLAPIAADAARRIHGRTVELDVPADLAVRGREEDVESLVRNLVDNAARYGRTLVRVSAVRRDDDIVLIVDDDGPGIPPGDRERVFERFARLSAHRGRHDGGVGLGLAVVARVASANGGAVTVTDSPWGGARFAVVLQRSDPG